MQKKVLGKGLSAILSDISMPQAAAAPAPEVVPEEDFTPRSPKVVTPFPQVADSGRVVLEVPLERIDVNPQQPRSYFDSEKLAELTNSIAQEGVIQPILLVQRGERYEIVAGERRFRATRAAGLDTVPAILTEVDERESLKLALVENIQRADLNPIEEARAFQVMIDEFSWTQEELGQYLGKDRSTISNTLRLLQLPGEVQGLLAKGMLSAGHVRTLINLDLESCLELARLIVRDHLSVRQAEQMAKARKRKSRGGQKPAAHHDPVIRTIRERMESKIGLPVKLQYSKGRGKLSVPFGSDRELERIMQILGVSLDGDQ
ncbi:MAG: ParB/RepB/Spo0J family partition protein [bacterium]|nr:ParB/RepB/Spo0J family partition protein [bacterium]